MTRRLGRRAEHQQPYVLPEGSSFLVAQVAVHAVVANSAGEVRPAVTAELQGRWNRAAEDVVVAALTPQQAREFAQLLAAAADQAERDTQEWASSGEG